MSNQIIFCANATEAIPLYISACNGGKPPAPVWRTFTMSGEDISEKEWPEFARKQIDGFNRYGGQLFTTPAFTYGWRARVPAACLFTAEAALQLSPAAIAQANARGRPRVK